MSQLIEFNRVDQQIAELVDLREIKDHKDQQAALVQYFKGKPEFHERVVLHAYARALNEARGGEVIREQQANGQLCVGHPSKVGESLQVGRINLQDLGINWNESQRMQLAADVKQQDPGWFRLHAIHCLETGQDFTQQAVIRRAKELRNAGLKKDIPPPKGKYDVIVIDPPWPMEKIEREVAPNQAAFDYPVMTEDELAAMKLPAAGNCHLWLWTTHRFLPMALRLVPQWGFAYVCTFVWHKPGGFQPFGLPQYNCEFALYCRHGSPQFADTKDFKVCFEAPRGSHSEKPSEFYDMVRRVTSGRRIDMFNRRPISGFKAWGNEA